jgi:hypothetical protein
LQCTVTSRRVDLIHEGIDVAIRVRERLDTKSGAGGRECLAPCDGQSPDRSGVDGQRLQPATASPLPMNPDLRFTSEDNAEFILADAA